jgi:hypothetical protein
MTDSLQSEESKKCGDENCNNMFLPTGEESNDKTRPFPICSDHTKLNHPRKRVRPNVICVSKLALTTMLLLKKPTPKRKILRAKRNVQ